MSNFNSTVTECSSPILSLTVPSDTLLWLALDGVLFVLIVSGNLVTLYVLCSGLQYSHLVSNRFVLSLAVADTMVGFTLLYHTAFYVAPQLAASPFACLLRTVLILLTCCASVINVMAIAIDRYFAILHPFKYESAMTNRRAHLLLAAGWLLALSISTAPIYWTTAPTPNTPCHPTLTLSFTRRLLVPAFVLVWTSMCVLYWRIWREAVHQAYKLRRGNVNELRRSCLQVVLTIMLTFTLTWSPHLLVITLTHPTTTSLYRSTLSLAFTSSALNPLIYAWKNAQFKHTFGHMLRCRTASHSLAHDHRSSLAESRLALQHEHRSSIVDAQMALQNGHRSSIVESKVPIINEHRSSIAESKLAFQHEHRSSIVESKLAFQHEHRSSIVESKVPIINEHRSSFAESKLAFQHEHRSSIVESKLDLQHKHRSSIIGANVTSQNKHSSSNAKSNVPNLNVHRSSIAESKVTLQNERRLDSKHRSSSEIGLHSKLTPSRETILLQPDV